jgi:hypothetical protein
MRYVSIMSVAATAMLGLAACSENNADQAATQAPLPPPAATAAMPDQAANTPIGPALPTSAALDWSNLDAAVGKYSNDINLFGQGPIADALRNVAGDKFDTLRSNLAVAGPLQKSQGVYYITGNAPHQGGVDQAYVLIDPLQQAVEVGLWQNGTLGVYATPGKSITKPEDVTTMIANATPTHAATVAH